MYLFFDKFGLFSLVQYSNRTILCLVWFEKNQTIYNITKYRKQLLILFKNNFTHLF